MTGGEFVEITDIPEDNEMYEDGMRKVRIYRFELFSKKSIWKESLELYEEIKFYDSKEAAMQENEFIDT